MASNKDNYVAVTIGPIFDTMSLVSTPAALWVSSYMFSYITKTICELLLECGVKEEDIITLEFDDDTAVDCYVMGTFELNDKEYIALAPEDGTDDVYIYGYKQVSDDEFEILEIESEEEFDAAAAEFDAIMEDEE